MINQPKERVSKAIGENYIGGRIFYSNKSSYEICKSH